MVGIAHTKYIYTLIYCIITLIYITGIYLVDHMQLDRIILYTIVYIVTLLGSNF